MKSISKLLISMMSAGLLFSGTNLASAEEADGSSGFEGSLQGFVVGGNPTHRVGYMYSATTSPRRALAISITNNSNTSCDTTVRWRAGGGQLIGTSSVIIPPGQTFEHCSRTLPGATVICNATSFPEVAPPQFIEGKADVHLAAACACRANVDAKQYGKR